MPTIHINAQAACSHLGVGPSVNSGQIKVSGLCGLTNRSPARLNFGDGIFVGAVAELWGGGMDVELDECADCNPCRLDSIVVSSGMVLFVEVVHLTINLTCTKANPPKKCSFTKTIVGVGLGLGGGSLTYTTH